MAHVQAAAYGERPKAIAVVLLRLLNSPSTWKETPADMKTFPSILCVLAASLTLAHAQQQPALLSDPPDGSEAPAPEVRAVFAPAEVLETTVTHQGGRDIIVQHLALDPNDPIKPVFPATIPASPGESSESAPAELSATAPSFLHILSATVHPGPRTFLNWTHPFADGSTRSFSGWSNIDFNHISGICTLLGTDGNQHSFFMGIGTEEIPAENAPAFNTNSPTFIPDQADIPAEALILVDSIHKIYATESEKLAAAHAGRERARVAEEAELLANPPQPKDLIIRYRIAETPLPTPAEGGAR